jgi:hypothetical protein
LAVWRFIQKAMVKTGAAPVGNTEVDRLAWYLSALLVLRRHLPILHSDGSVM